MDLDKLYQEEQDDNKNKLQELYDENVSVISYFKEIDSYITRFLNSRGSDVDAINKVSSSLNNVLPILSKIKFIIYDLEDEIPESLSKKWNKQVKYIKEMMAINEANLFLEKLKLIEEDIEQETAKKQQQERAEKERVEKERVEKELEKIDKLDQYILKFDEEYFNNWINIKLEIELDIANNDYINAVKKLSRIKENINLMPLFWKDYPKALKNLKIHLSKIKVSTDYDGFGDVEAAKDAKNILGTMICDLEIISNKISTFSIDDDLKRKVNSILEKANNKKYYIMSFNERYYEWEYRDDKEKISIAEATFEENKDILWANWEEQVL